MLVLEFKTYPTTKQQSAINNAIRIGQFIRNKAIRQWKDAPQNNTKVGRNSLNKLSKTLSQEFDFVKPLNSTARQAAVERAWSGIVLFYKGLARKPKFQKDNRSVEFKQSGWKLSPDYKRILFTSCHIGSLKLKGTRNLQDFSEFKILRVRIVKRADGYHIQFCINTNRQINHTPTGRAIGIDVGLRYFLTDSDGNTVANPRFLRKAETVLKRLHRRHSKCKKKSNNREKARIRLARKHLHVSRQRKDFAIKTARQTITNSDFVGIEDLSIRQLMKDRIVAKSFSDAGLYQFRQWLEYFGKISEVPVIAVPPEYTTQECSGCGIMVWKTRSERTHSCLSCGLVLDRDWNAAKNILSRALSLSNNTVGHTGISHNASGEAASMLMTGSLVQAASLKEESAAGL